MTICECGLLVVPAIYDSKGPRSCKVVAAFFGKWLHLGTLPLQHRLPCVAELLGGQNESGGWCDAVQSLAYSKACLSRKRTSFAKLTPRFYLPESFQKFLSNYFELLGRNFFTFNPQQICSAVDGPRSLQVNARYTRFFRVTGGETTTHLVPSRRTRQEKIVNLVW